MRVIKLNHFRNFYYSEDNITAKKENQFFVNIRNQMWVDKLNSQDVLLFLIIVIYKSIFCRVDLRNNIKYVYRIHVVR